MESLDFDAQIADTTISMLQYNILSLAKKFLDYESMGEMFRQAGTETLELTIVEKIWVYPDIDMEEILDKIASDNHGITKNNKNESCTGCGLNLMRNFNN